MKNTCTRKPSAGSRIIASLRVGVDWVEGKDVPVRVTTVEVPTIDVRATRKRLGLSQAAFAAKFGFCLPPCGIGSEAERDQTVRRECCSPSWRAIPKLLRMPSAERVE